MEENEVVDGSKAYQGDMSTQALLERARRALVRATSSSSSSSDPLHSLSHSSAHLPVELAADHCQRDLKETLGDAQALLQNKWSGGKSAAAERYYSFRPAPPLPSSSSLSLGREPDRPTAETERNGARGEQGERQASAPGLSFSQLSAGPGLTESMDAAQAVRLRRLARRSPPSLRKPLYPLSPAVAAVQPKNRPVGTELEGRGESEVSVPVAAIRVELKALAEALAERSRDIRRREAELEADASRTGRGAAAAAAEDAGKPAQLQQAVTAAKEEAEAAEHARAQAEAKAVQSAQRAAGLERDTRRLRKLLAELRADNVDMRRERDTAASEVTQLRARLRQANGRALALRRQLDAHDASQGDEAAGLGEPASTGAAKAKRGASSAESEDESKQGGHHSQRDRSSASSTTSRAQQDHAQMARAALDLLSAALPPALSAPSASSMGEDDALRVLAASARLLPVAAASRDRGANACSAPLLGLLSLSCRALRTIAASSRRPAFLGTLRRLGEATLRSAPLHAAGATAAGAAEATLANMAVLMTLTQGGVKLKRTAAGAKKDDAVGSRSDPCAIQ
jgi:hypothetical protein